MLLVGGVQRLRGEEDCNFSRVSQRGFALHVTYMEGRPFFVDETSLHRGTDQTIIDAFIP